MSERNDLKDIDPVVVKYWTEWFVAYRKRVPDDAAFAVWINVAEELVGNMIEGHMEDAPSMWLDDEEMP